MIVTSGAQIPKTDQVPTPLLLAFLLVALAISGGVAIAPRRVLNILFLGHPAVEELPGPQLNILRFLAACTAVCIIIVLVKWKVSGVPF